MEVKVLLLDLDHTLFDPESIPRAVMEPAFEELRAANRRTGAVAEAALEIAIPELMGAPITAVARRHGWPDELRRVALEASARVVLPPTLPLFPDVAAIVRLGVRKILVTTGVPTVQRQKIDALGIRAWLDGVHVDDALAAPRRGKRAIFEAILRDEDLPPEAALVVGDNLESEIAAGMALGLRTFHVARWGCGPRCPAAFCRSDLRGIEAAL